MHDSDPNLIESCLAGRPDAWNELVDRYGRLVYSVLYRNRLSQTDAEDLFQTVFTLLFRNLARLRDQKRLSSWLITTAHREAWRLLRHRRRLAGSSEALDDQPAPLETDQVELLERQVIVQKGLELLGGSCEALLRALFLNPEPPSYDEISARLDMPIGSIGPTRARCFRKFQEILAKLGYQDPGGE